MALGIPADLLRRRPDIRRIERQAAAQSSLIGFAKADLYPRFSLFGSVGVQADDFKNLFDTPGSFTGSVGPAFHWDLFNYGRIEGNVQVQEARYKQLAYGYQNAVLRAGREAEDAAVAFLKAQERAKYLESSVVAAARTVEITSDQFKQGVVDFTPVFLFEGTLADQQDQLALAEGQIALNLVDLYRAVGGGWEMRLRKPTTMPTTRPTTRPTTTRPSTIGAAAAAAALMAPATGPAPAVAAPATRPAAVPGPPK
jgi:outer membrane protein TolC